MPEPTFKQTFCILCYVNCGLEVSTEGRKITRVRGDRANERSKGYLCRKPQRLQWYGNHADRLTTPLRRRRGGGGRGGGVGARPRGRGGTSESGMSVVGAIPAIEKAVFATEDSKEGVQSFVEQHEAWLHGR